MEIIDKASARAAGLKRFFSGEPCKKCGGVYERHTGNGECVECNRRRSSQWARDFPEKANARSKRSRAKRIDRVREYNREYKKEHPEKNRGALRRSYKRERERQIELAGSPVPAVCEVCGCPPAGNAHNGKALHFDHDHSSGRFRGWICFSCNVALGSVRDNIDTLLALVDYLRKNECRVAESVKRTESITTPL